MNLVSRSELDRLWLTEFNSETIRSYFNNASIAPLPRCGKEAITSFVYSSSASTTFDYDDRLKLEQTLKRRISSLIGAAGPDDIALVSNTSAGLSKVIFGISYLSCDEVIVLADDFTSIRLAASVLKAKGIRVIEVAYDPYSSIDELVLAAFSENTRLVVVSSVLYSTGVVLDLCKIGLECRNRNVLFCVDAIQHVGAMPFNVLSNYCDFAVADGHKWMLGLEGLGFFYSRPESRCLLSLQEYGWHMLQNQWTLDTNDFRVSSTARCFESGSPNYLAMSALEASLSLLSNVGASVVQQLLSSNIRLFACLLLESKLFSIQTPAHMFGLSGILCFKSNFLDSDSLVRLLKERHITMALRGNCVRFSPGFYSSVEGVENAASTLIDLVKLHGSS